MTNSEGLTWREWFRATMFNESDFTAAQLKSLKTAWKLCEDPTEYRAAGSTIVSASIQRKLIS